MSFKTIKELESKLTEEKSKAWNYILRREIKALNDVLGLIDKIKLNDNIVIKDGNSSRLISVEELKEKIEG